MMASLLAVLVDQVAELVRGTGLAPNVAATIWLILGGWRLAERVKAIGKPDPLEALRSAIVDDLRGAINVLLLEAEVERLREKLREKGDLP